MKATILAIVCLLELVFLSATADTLRFATVTYTSTPYATNGPDLSWGGTNTIEIAEGETGELISTEPNPYWYSPQYPARASVTKGGVTVNALPAGGIPNYSGPGTTVAGPAVFTVYSAYSCNCGTAAQGLMTVKITPMTFNPNQTVTVAPGVGNVLIEMESSTNLVSWSTATNGVYNDSLKFFRVKLTKLP